ncbi:Hypothetical protein FKW44_021057, partial [Caligus rogercresseyi]
TKKIAENGQRLFTIIDEATQRVSTSTGENEGNKQQVGGDQDEVLQEPTGENEGNKQAGGDQVEVRNGPNDSTVENIDTPTRKSDNGTLTCNLDLNTNLDTVEKDKVKSNHIEQDEGKTPQKPPMTEKVALL